MTLRTLVTVIEDKNLTDCFSTNQITFYFTGNLTFKLIEFLKRVQISKI